jgi:hypothetical protein
MPYAERNGLKLYYERDGSGEPELLFIPGRCCDHTFYEPQFDYFKSSACRDGPRPAGLRAQQLPGERLRLPTLADDVAWFCAEIGIDDSTCNR